MPGVAHRWKLISRVAGMAIPAVAIVHSEAAVAFPLGMMHGPVGQIGPSPNAPPWSIVLGFLLVGGFMVMVLANKAGQGATKVDGSEQSRLERLLAAAASRDAVWQEDAFLEQAKEMFWQVQRAWVMRDQEIARGVMTPGFYHLQKTRTDAMRDRGERDVLDRLEIKAARIVYMADYLDDSRDEVWVHFTARAFDYMVDDHSGRLLKGQPDCLSVTRTIWKFKRQRDQWRVDAIEHNASQALPRSFSETARD